MSAHPFRRVGRNLAAVPFIWLGTALANRGVRVMWPDDRPQSETDIAIVRVGATLEHAVQRYTDAVISGRHGKHEVRALNKLIRQFLDLRAAVLGDFEWLAHREREEAAKRERAREADAALTAVLGPVAMAERDLARARRNESEATQ